MTKEQKTYLVLGVGAVALWFWYRSRSGGGSLFGSLLSGQGTAGGGSPNPSLGGSSPYTTSDPQMSEAEHYAARNRATGALSRGQCLVPSGRWIDTSTAPYYGLCVTQAKFDLWQSGAQSFTGLYPTLDYVKRVLSL